MKSKKQFDVKPPDGTVFFIDRSLGVEPVRTELASAGLVVKTHDEHFARDEADHVWLRSVGGRNWVVLTKDQRLKYRPLEIGALRAARVRVFVLIAGNLRGIEIAAVFRLALPRICRILHVQAGPFLARVSQSGHVTVDRLASPLR